MAFVPRTDLGDLEMAGRRAEVMVHHIGLVGEHHKVQQEAVRMEDIGPGEVEAAGRSHPVAAEGIVQEEGTVRGADSDLLAVEEDSDLVAGEDNGPAVEGGTADRSPGAALQLYR